MGTKKPSWTLFDTLSAHISSDRSHRPGRKSRDPSPRPGATAPTERERTPEEEWREREMDRLKQDKARSKRKDTDPRERYPERERAPSPRARRGERDRRDREGRQEAETRPNGRPVSHFETRVLDREAERARNKGDTFPRMRRVDDHRDRRRDQFGEKDAARGDRRPMERQQRTATDDLERERERMLRRERQGDGERYKERDGDKNIGRPIDDRTVRQRDRPRETDPGSRERRRERDPEVNDPCNRKEKDMVRDRDRLQPNMGERQGPRGASPRRRPERDPCTDDERQERAEGRAEKRGTRSEGNSDEEMSKKTQRERADRNEPRHSRSEGDDKGRVARERDGDRHRYREEERQRDGGRDTGRHVRQEEGRDRDRDGGKEREGERRREGEREAKGARSDGRQKERERYRDREGEERRRRNERSEREADPRRVRAAGRGSHGGGPPQAQSSGEWSSDVDSDRQRQRVREEDRESGRESTAESEREAKEKGGSASVERGVGGGTERGHEERQRGGRHDGERWEERTRQRKMWLEPRRGNYSQGSSLEDEVGEERTESSTGTGREGHKVKEELDERYSDPRAARVTYLEQREREEEGVSVDGEEVREAWAGKDRGRVEGRRLGDKGGSCDSSEWSGSEGGGRTDGERDKMLSGEDGFVTASSGGDEEDERLYRDSRESWEGEDSNSGHKGHGREREAQEGSREESEDRVHGEGDSREGDRQVTEKKTTIVFCVIGQTLPRSDRPSKSTDLSVDTRQSSSGSSVCGDNITHQRHSDSPPIPSRIDQRPVININPDQESEAEREGDNVLNEARAYTDDTSRVIRYTTEPKESETGGGAKGKVEHPYAEIGPIRKNSETEKLLAAWRERETLLTDQTEKEGGSLASPINPYDEVGYQGDSAPVSAPSDENGPINMCPEEKEVAIRIRMSGAWSLAEEAKRHSQAPHLKWAKNVVFEILGSSEEHAIVDDPQPGSQEGQEVNQPDEMPEGEQQQEEQEEEEEEMVGEGAGEMPVYATVQKQKAGNQNSGTELSEGEGEAEPLEMEELRDGEDCRSDSWGEVDLRNVLDNIGSIGRRKRNSKFFNVGPLYQQYSDNAQNIEILRQARSDTISIPVPSSSSPPSSPTSSSPTSSSPTSSPPPARRPLPPLPPVPHPHSLSHTGSITSIKSLPLPELPASQGRRSSSPRLSIAPNTQTLWQDLPGVRNSTELGEFTEDQRRLQEVRFEVVTSEASYCRSLDIVVDNFVKSKQLGALLAIQDRNWLFSRLADVRAISHSFLSKLEERVETNTMHFSVCDIIARHCKRFGMVYVPYLTNQSYQDATYQRLMNENLKFKQVVEKLERSPVCQRLPLRSFLILPFQRITRIKLLVQNIVKRTAPGTEEVVHAIKALRMLEKLIQESNDSITQMKSIESLVSLSAKVDFECRTLPLVSQSRRLVREGPVTELMDFSLKETERTVYLHLFNDYLLLSLHKEGGRFTVIDHSPVSDLRAENCRVKLHSLQKNLFRLHLSNKALLLRTDTQSDKLRWISAVSRPHPEVDFSAAQDSKQMQCIRAIVAHQPDELSLEKADIILVHQQSSDGWVEGTRLSDRNRGWIPESHLETITNSKVQERNLSDALKLTTATAAV